MNISYRPMLPDDLDWLQLRTNAVPASDIVGMVAEIDGHRAAVVGAERWSETAAWVHLVVDDPRSLANNALLDQIAGYIFGTRGRRYMLSTTSSLNEASLKLQKGIGFKEIGRIDNGFDEGEDVVILRLEAAEWFKRRGH